MTDRIPIRIHIPPLDSDQVKQYVRHRMTAAGCRREVFVDDGLLLISKATAASCAASCAGDPMSGIGRQREVQSRRCDDHRSRHPGLCGGIVMTSAVAPSPFPVVRPCDLRVVATSSTPWLIDQLWTAQAVGIIGGTPKSYKTWMALEMAVSVASGSACLASFAVPSPGTVLLYAAEDSESALRSRLESLARHHGLDLACLDIRVITADSLRLDRIADQERLEATLTLHRPVLLILDPLVRLHAIDENAAGEIAALLGYLRILQRKTGAAIALVHHAKKNLSANGGAGYSLRGSSDLYAWVDSFLYLLRHHDQLMLSAEHRSASGAEPFALELANPESGPYLNSHLR
jgi:AAA domain